MIAGAAAGALILVISVIAAIFYFRRKKRYSNTTLINTTVVTSGQSFLPTTQILTTLTTQPEKVSRPVAYSPSEHWPPISGFDVARYSNTFKAANASGGAYLDGNSAIRTLRDSGLRDDILSKIWDLADIDLDGQLTLEEFVTAMYLTERAAAGQAIPKLLSQIPPGTLPKLEKKRPVEAVSSGLPPLPSDSELLPPVSSPVPSAPPMETVGNGEKAESTALTPETVCKECGAAQIEGAKFCANCGSRY